MPDRHATAVKILLTAVFLGTLGDFLFLIEDVQWKLFGQRTDLKKWAPVARGLVIAVPLVLIFGALMASADAVFQKFVTQPLNFDPTELIAHGALFVVFAGLSIVMLR